MVAKLACPLTPPPPYPCICLSYSGGRPWAEPGKSLSNVGPCGLKRYAQKTNFHQPGHGWGVNVTATYQAGDVIDVAWCVSDLADHGGLYSYRVCTDDALVARFTDPNHTPSDDEMASLEVCFAAGILSCADVPGQDCPVHPDCQSGWGCVVV